MKKRILLVDDEPDIQTIVSARLAGLGYEVLTAKDGQEGLDLVREKMPDLVVLDVILPGMYGDEVAKILKKDEELKRIPIILISAEIETLEERARKSGVEGYLSKPFDTKELLNMIEKLLSAPAK